MDQRIDVGAEANDQRDGEESQYEDAVRIRQSVSEVAELARREAVVGERREQAREALIGGVRRQDQDRERGSLDEIEQKAAPAIGREDRAGDLRDHRDALAR